MRKIVIILFAVLGLAVTACSTSAKAPTATPEIIPTVIADDTVIAEGRVEPIHYAEIAFGTSARWPLTAGRSMCSVVRRGGGAEHDDEVDVVVLLA